MIGFATHIESWTMELIECILSNRAVCSPRNAFKQKGQMAHQHYWLT